MNAAVDLAGLELISHTDFTNRNLYEFFRSIQYQLDTTCQNLFNENHHYDYSIYRNILKSFGIVELESENVFEVELTKDGSCNVYVLRDKKLLLIRNHLGDHVAMATKNNSNEYDPHIIRCFKALMNYTFRYLFTGDQALVDHVNSSDYCFEVCLF